jgi:hypothetical protein
MSLNFPVVAAEMAGFENTLLELLAHLGKTFELLLAVTRVECSRVGIGESATLNPVERIG